MKIRWNERELRKDIRWQHIKYAELEQIEKLIRQVAACHRPKDHPAIESIAQTRHEWYRIKHCGTNTRTIVEFKRIEGEEMMVVKHLLRRVANMYDWVEIWFCVEHGYDTRYIGKARA